MITSKIMTPQEWIAVKDNPIQRDTEHHAKKAVLGHLKQESATHARVAAAILPNGEMYKLDGHTRSYLWQIEKLAPPKTVLVDVYHVDTVADVIELYKHFDNVGAVETANDRLRGALRLHGINAKSGVILHGGLNTALALIYNKSGRASDVEKPIKNFKNEIIQLDSLGLSNAGMSSPIIAAAIVALRVYGQDVLTFLTAYHGNQGRKIGKERDAVQALIETLLIAKANKTKTGGYHSNIVIMGRALSAIQAYLENRTYTGSIKATDVKSYIEKHKDIIFQ